MTNLRDRLNRIREFKKGDAAVKSEKQAVIDVSALTDMGWESCGYLTLKREVAADTLLKTRKKLPAALAVIVPDLAVRELSAFGDFLFFDLETTGLSGGAGIVAFLAAFGRATGGGKLRITQYLLLDYPGENDFLDAVLKEFKDRQSVIVSYNGKCFDSQILKTRCLMNGIKPPEYFHADLLHPARRLWKNIILDCSQGSVETKILGLDRSGDTSGALAPEIWFDFLKTGRIERLIGICDHNCADIAGLASILAAMICIADDPLAACQGAGKFPYDQQRLALYWRGFLRRSDKIRDNAQYDDLRITGNRLLLFAAEKNYPRAAFVYAADQLRLGNFKEGRKRLLNIAELDFPENVKAAAFRALAIDSERRLKCPKEALEFVMRGLELRQPGGLWRNEFEKRKERIERRLQENGL